MQKSKTGRMGRFKYPNTGAIPTDHAENLRSSQKCMASL